MNQKQLNEIKLRWKGKGGGPEAETTVVDSKLDKDCVHVWSCNSDISRIIDIEDSPKEVSRVRIKHPTDEEGAYCEKNWMPVRDIPFTYLKHANPPQVVKVNPENGDCWIVEQKDKIDSLPDTRGGSQVLSYKGGYIAVTHDTMFWYFTDRGDGNKDAIYHHRIIFWDKDWNIQKVSKPFHFMDGQIEFCCGMEYMA